MLKKWLQTFGLLVFTAITAAVATAAAPSALNLTFSPGGRYGVFPVGEPVSVNLTRPTGATTPETVSLALSDVDGKAVWSHRLTLDAGRPATVKLPSLPVGWYRLEATGTDNGKPGSIPLAVIPVDRGNAASPFGMMNPYLLPLQHRLGVRWLRLPLDWHRIEKEKGQFDWSRADRLVAEARRSGIELIGLVGFCPQWASSAPRHRRFMIYPPADLRDYGNFVAAAVARYKNDVRYWEIWNEPDVLGGFWGGTYEQFGPLLETGYRAAKQANPSCKVIFGGTSWASTRLLETVLKNGGGKYFDIMADHPYSTAAWIDALRRRPDYEPHRKKWQEKHQTDFPYHSTWTRADRIRAVLSRHGCSQPLWATETGATTGGHWPFVAPSRLSYAEQSHYLFKALVEALGAGFEKVILYQFTCKPEPDAEENFGIFNHDRTPRPSLVTYAVVASMLYDLRSARKIWPTPEKGINGDVSALNVYEFDLPDGHIYALWNNDPAREKTLRLSVPETTLISRDAAGAEKRLACPAGTITLPVGTRPFFLFTPHRKAVTFSP